ncbi:hypothetical protein RchiOBHm_Chr5g0076701 [Rosa chinensis]|uniref:Uncharacterized protein n=1 Tax=Rosa chinensis TaxID=74649 RepID=A0A2P6QLS9_ROSCH|nr:hypothetical protein RchiOBHm_Chr5g0076701 [Rosa chinensis]
MDDNIKGNRLCSSQDQLLLSLFNIHFKGSITGVLRSIFRCSIFQMIFQALQIKASSTPAELKRKRGIKTGKGMIQMIARNSNKKMEIIFDRMYWVLITEYMYSKFTTSIGIQVRSRAPVCYYGWNKIPVDIKKTLREGLTVHFDVEIEHPKIVNFVNN